jgi:hypothetical protein
MRAEPCGAMSMPSGSVSFVSPIAAPLISASGKCFGASLIVPRFSGHARDS